MPGELDFCFGKNIYRGTKTREDFIFAYAQGVLYLKTYPAMEFQFTLIMAC